MSSVHSSSLVVPSSLTESDRDDRDLFRKPFRFYFKKHLRTFTIGIIAVFFTNLFDVLTPLALGKAIDALQAGSTPHLTQSIAIFMGLMVGVAIFRFLWRVYFGRFHYSVAEDLRNRIFEKCTTLGPSYYQKTPVGTLMSLITNDVNTFRSAIGPGTLILMDAAFYIGLIVPIMISISWGWTWRTLIVLPLVPFFLRKMEALVHVRSRAEQDRLADMSGRAQEIISGVRVIKSFAQEGEQLKSFNVFSKNFEVACNQLAKVDATFLPVMEFTIVIGTSLLLWLCTPDVVLGAVSLGTFYSFADYIRRMIWPMSAIGMGISMVEQGRSSFDRIREMLTTPTDIPDLGRESVERFEKLEIRDLTFTYPSATIPALADINLTIRAGETIGLVGPVGAGKTTLLQILARLYPVEPGHVLVNGKSLESISRASLTQLISLVPQDAFLFSESVSENIALGLSDFPGLEPIESATQTVNLDHEIRSMPLSYASQLGERGVNLSGGQKQRLTIARAIIRQSGLIVFDDSLSAVDGKTELGIVNELKEARKRRPDQTVILVSHRLATLKHADRILVLQHGRIEAEGTHDELLASSATYKVLNDLQQSASSGSEESVWDIVPESGLKEPGGLV